MVSTVRPGRISPYNKGTLFWHWLSVVTLLQISTDFVHNKYFFTPVHNVMSLLRCVPSLSACSIDYIFKFVIIMKFADSLFLFGVEFSTLREMKYFKNSLSNSVIMFPVFPSSCSRSFNSSPIFFHLPLYFTFSVNITNGSYTVSLLCLFSADSTSISCTIATVVFLKLYSMSGLDFASPCGHQMSPSGPTFYLFGMCFTVKLSTHIHMINHVTSAHGWVLVAILSWSIYVLLSISSRNLTHRHCCETFINVPNSPRYSHFTKYYHFSASYQGLFW